MSAIDELEEDLRIASKILEWEMGDIWGHVGVRVPGEEAVAVKLFRRPEEEGAGDWLMNFDYSLKKLSGVGGVPSEATIYTGILKARPDVNAVVHTHAPMCVALSLVDKTVANVHMQSRSFGAGVPIYPRPIYILDHAEGDELAQALGQASAVIIKGHGTVTVGRSIDEACITALYLERIAKIQAIAYTLGYTTPTDAYRQEILTSFDKMIDLANTPGRVRPAHSAEWSYYADKVRKGEVWARGWP